MGTRPYSDAELAGAVASAHSWRGVLRSLGLNESSAGSMRSARRRAELLGLSHAHFTGQRRWSDGDLRAAVAAAGSWQQVATLLHLVPDGGTRATLRAHAVRLGLPTEHLTRHTPALHPDKLPAPYRPAFLRNAGSLFAATWFTLRGATVSWPLEPCRYDLIADAAGNIQRIQVKTTTTAGPEATVSISNSRRAGRAVYAPGEIDAFFALDADLNAYLIPYRQVAGYIQIQLNRYAGCRVVERGRLIPEAAA